MNMKKTIILIILILCLKLIAQESVSIFYNQNWEITTVKKATYYRITGLNNTGDSCSGKFSDYLLKGNKMITSGEYISNKKNNEYIEYFENGNIKQKGNYKDDLALGRWFYYYPNGNLKMVIDFGEKDYQFVEYRDSLNNITLKNGNGIWRTEIDVYGIPTKLKATFKNGKPYGSWEYIDKNGKEVLNEIYKYFGFESATETNQKGTIKINRPYFNYRYFYNIRNNAIDRMICERDLNVKFTPVSWVVKKLSLANTTNISYMNSKLPADQILCMTVDKNNTYWIGTANNGLLKYDSVFTCYNNKNTKITSNYVSRIAIDNNDKIWFSFSSGIKRNDNTTAGLACLSDNKTEIYTTKNSGLTYNEISDIAVDKNNKKWFATRNCIVSYDDLKNNWEKHINTSNSIRAIDTIKLKSDADYFSYAKKLSKKWNSDYTIQSTEYEKLLNYYSIDVLPGNEKLIGSYNSVSYIYNDTTWESDTTHQNIGYIKFTLKKKFQLDDQDVQLFMNQCKRIVKNNFILRLIKGIDNSIWALTQNNIFKITKNKIIEFDLNNKDINYVQDGDFKGKYYNLFRDKDGSIWACINSAILKIE